MSDRIPINPFSPHPIRPGQVKPSSSSPVKPNVQGNGSTHADAASFKNILQQKILSFSSHAEMRLRQRGITLQTEQIEKINAAIDKAAAKGARDSLLIMNDLAMIVNVKNRTVVTAMDGKSLQDHVFTQIDSAVIIP